MPAIAQVFLFCLFTLTVVSENRCEFSQACSVRFVNSDTQFIGCANVISSSVFTRPMASLNCLNNIQCKAISCNYSVCSTCNADQIISLSFNSPGMTYLKRNLILNIANDPVTLSMSEYINLPDRLNPGDLVYIKATVLKYDNFIVDFLMNDDNTYLHFRTRCNNECANTYTCNAAVCESGKYMSITSKINKSWANNAITDFHYPFKLNQQFELHFLVLADSVLCYINRKYYAERLEPFTSQSVNAIQIRGTVNVHEFSF